VTEGSPKAGTRETLCQKTDRPLQYWIPDTRTHEFQLGDKDAALEGGIFGALNHRLPSEEVVLRNRPGGEHVVRRAVACELLVLGHEAS
jgi:hypothetical protein